MADERNYYVICADGCKFESMTKEQILAAITQAVETGEIKDVDTGFVTKIKEQNSGLGLSFWVGTQAEYNALETKPTNCFSIITDDTFAEDINAAVDEMQSEVNILTNTVEDYAQRLDEQINKNGVVLLGDGSTLIPTDTQAEGLIIKNIANYTLVRVQIWDNIKIDILGMVNLLGDGAFKIVGTTANSPNDTSANVYHLNIYGTLDGNNGNILYNTTKCFTYINTTLSSVGFTALKYITGIM